MWAKDGKNLSITKNWIRLHTVVHGSWSMEMIDNNFGLLSLDRKSLPIVLMFGLLKTTRFKVNEPKIGH